MYEFGKEMKFDIKQVGRPSNRDKSLIKLPISPAIMASGVSTKFLPGKTNEPCERLKLILQEKQAGDNSNIINDDIVAIVDKLLENNCIWKKQLKIFLLKCSN